MKFLKTAALFAFIAMPLVMLTFPDAHAAEVKKAKTIDELATMYDSSSCKQCHEDIYKDWEKSIHSRSIFGTGRTAATIKTTVAVGLTGWKHPGVKKPQDLTVK